LAAFPQQGVCKETASSANLLVDAAWPSAQYCLAAYNCGIIASICIVVSLNTFGGLAN
jgi:hypothetical protein